MGSTSTTKDTVKEELFDQDTKEIEELEWTVEQDILLLYSLHGYKPVGPNKHFRMLAIRERFSRALNKNVSSKVIWDKLNSLYDLEALDEAEAEHDATHAVVVDFSLPEEEYGPMMTEKTDIVHNKLENLDNVSDKDNNEVLEMLNDIKTEPEPSEQLTETVNETPKATAKEVIKKESAKRGPKKKEATLTSDNSQKKDALKETPKKDLANKKETTKDPKRAVSKEEETKSIGKRVSTEPKKDQVKEDKKDTVTKTNKKEPTDKKVADQGKRESEVKRVDQKKTPDVPKNQRAEGSKPRAETPKQLKTETKKAESKTLRSETPKLQRTENSLKPQRLEALKKESGSEKKKEIIDKKLENKSPEKTPELRGAKLRTREKKDTESDKSDTNPASKRERSRDSTSKNSDTPSEEPPVKKIKTPAPKGRPTRNSLDPQQKSSGPAVNANSPSKRRSRLL